MVVNTFKTLYDSTVPRDTGIRLQPQGDFPHRILYKTRVLIGFFRHILFIGAL